jgi:DNA-binding transcriptional LysR family regulator
LARSTEAVRYTLRQLEIFVEAASDCNFARAAARLGISQPAVSDHIRALERNLGSELFERRRGSTAVLTPAGERLRQEAELVLQHGARLADRAVAASRSAPLRVFAGPHIFDRMLRPALPAFHRAHPDIELNFFSELSSGDVRGMMQRRELDVAVFTAPAANIPREAELLADVPCVVVAARRLVADRQLTPDEISRLPFVLPPESAPAAPWVLRTLAQLGVFPETIAGRTQFLDVQQSMVEAGEAAALLFRESIEVSPVRQELRRLSPDALGLQRAILTRRADRRPEVQAVAAFVRRAIQGARAEALA